MSELNELVSQVKLAANKLKSEIATIDNTIEQLNKRRSSIVSGMVSKEDFISFLKLDIDQKGQQYKSLMGKNIDKFPKDFATLRRAMDPTSSAKFYISYINEFGTGGFSESAVFFLFSDQIKSAMEKVVESMDWPKNTVNMAIENKVLDDVDAEITTLNNARDGLADQMVKAGLMS